MLYARSGLGRAGVVPGPLKPPVVDGDPGLPPLKGCSPSVSTKVPMLEIPKHLMEGGFFLWVADRIGVSIALYSISGHL
jgi:hypothetical protein